MKADVDNKQGYRVTSASWPKGDHSTVDRRFESRPLLLTGCER